MVEQKESRKNKEFHDLGVIRQRGILGPAIKLGAIEYYEGRSEMGYG